MASTTTSISFYTQGCRLNQSETATLEQQCRADGFKVSSFKEGAEIVVINTCTVTENGDADTRRLVNKIHRQHPASKVALIGCQAQILKEKLSDLPNVSWIIGNQDKMALPNILLQNKAPLTPYIHTPKITKDTFSQQTPGIDNKHTRANIKIQDGCNFYCAFCIIPFARGPARSRDYHDIIREAQLLSEAGHKEIVLTGINLGTYLHEMRTITDVLKGLEKVPGLERIRISSIEPTTIPMSVINRIGQQESTICRHLHVPLQAGSETILKAMNRHYTINEFKQFMDSALIAIPDCSFGTDIIVGFPGETNSLFDEAVDFVKQQAFSYLHVFSYSERTMARSRKMEGKIAAGEVKRRSQVMRDLSSQKQSAFYSSFIGKTVNVLFEQLKNGYWTGLTDNYIKVHVKSKSELKNQILPVKLQQLKNGALIGECDD